MSCMELAYADRTATQGKNVASLGAMMVCIRAFLQLLDAILFLPLVLWQPSLGHRNSGINVRLSVVLQLLDF